jgi:hypothetical protein
LQRNQDRNQAAAVAPRFERFSDHRPKGPNGIGRAGAVNARPTAVVDAGDPGMLRRLTLPMNTIDWLLVP